MSGLTSTLLQEVRGAGMSQTREGRTSSHPAACALLLCAACLLLARAIGAAGIFDEPEPPVAPRVAMPGKVAVAVAATSPAANLVRLAVPAGPQQAKLRKQFKEVLAKELADGSVAARRALAERLLRDAAKTNEPAERYVLLTAARQAGIDVADLNLCVRALDGTAAVFDIDAGRLKLDAALRCVGKSESATVTADNARAAMGMFDALVAADELAVASRLGEQIVGSLGGDPLLAALAERRFKDCETIRAARERLGPLLERLKVAPDDAGANYVVGTFYCFTKEDWAQGLAMLAKGTDAVLRRLAMMEAANPQAAEAVATLADEWWEWAQEQPEPARTVARRHAAAAYGRAIVSLSIPAVRRAAIEKRIDEAGHLASARLVDLLALADPRHGSVHGAWTTKDGTLVSPTGIDLFELPYEPADEYIFRVEFTRLKGDQGIAQVLAKGPKASFLWTVNRGGSFAGFDGVKGSSPGVAGNPAWKMLPASMESNRRYVSTVEVRNGRVRGWFDGKLLVDWKTDYHNVGPRARGNWSPRDPARLGVATWYGQTVFHRIEVLELTGEGKVIR
jgi:hypothetical protein